MVEVTIYGASDDLIEVEGDVHDEFSCDGEGKVVVIGPLGQVVEVSVRLGDEWWEASARTVRHDDGLAIFTIPRPDRPKDGDMAVRISLTGDGTPLVYQVVNE